MRKNHRFESSDLWNSKRNLLWHLQSRSIWSIGVPIQNRHVLKIYFINGQIYWKWIKYMYNLQSRARIDFSRDLISTDIFIYNQSMIIEL